MEVNTVVDIVISAFGRSFKQATSHIVVVIVIELHDRRAKLAFRSKIF